MTFWQLFANKISLRNLHFCLFSRLRNQHCLLLFVESPKVTVRRPWSEAERSAVNKHLGKFMAERRVPGKVQCMQCIEEEKALRQRSWKDVKNFVHNTIVTLNRRSASRKLAL